MAKPILVANWKNHPGSSSEASFLLRNLSRDRDLYKKLSFSVAPPLVYLSAAKEKVGHFANIGVQDFPQVLKGTHTGMVTPDILKSFGIKLAIIGHSERRAMGESSQNVAEKAKAALASGILPLICVGELMRDQDGEHFEFLRDEIKQSLAGLSQKEIARIALAYEPVWAIGKTAKDALSPADLGQALLFIRKVLSDLYGRKCALAVPILYGGSVEPVNVEGLYRETGIAGFLVGHASLDAKSLKMMANSLISK